MPASSATAWCAYALRALRRSSYSLSLRLAPALSSAQAPNSAASCGSPSPPLPPSASTSSPAGSPTPSLSPAGASPSSRLPRHHRQRPVPPAPLVPPDIQVAFEVRDDAEGDWSMVAFDPQGQADAAGTAAVPSTADTAGGAGTAAIAAAAAVTKTATGVSPTARGELLLPEASPGARCATKKKTRS